MEGLRISCQKEVYGSIYYAEKAISQFLRKGEGKSRFMHCVLTDSE